MGDSARGGEQVTQLHVAVLMGGWSNEREVSLMSGNGVAEALESLGHRVTRIDMDRDVAVRLAESAPDVVFNALHGTPGEDGTVQGMLDLMGLPYTHSGLVTSVIAIDKQLTKQALIPHGIPMPGGRMVATQELYEHDPLPRPYVLKPVNEGSSVGVAIVTQEGNYGNPIAAEAKGPWQEFDELLAEPFIRGRELTVAVLGNEALGVTELKPKSGFYDYDAKYTDGMTEHVCPAEIPDDIAEACKRIALRIAPLARMQGRVALGFPLGRRARRRRAVPARGQHPARHDPAQPGPRAGEVSRHELRGSRPEDRRRGAFEGLRRMSKRVVRRAPTRRPAPKKRAQARKKGPGLFEQAMAALPISQVAWKRIATWGIVGTVGVVALGVASWFGLPAKAGVAVSEVIGEAGFRVQEIEVTGLKRMDRMTVYAQALDQQSRAMPLVDLAGVRARLLNYPWIEDARVSRRLARIPC